RQHRQECRCHSDETDSFSSTSHIPSVTTSFQTLFTFVPHQLAAMTRTRLFAAAVLAVVLGATVARTAPDVAPPPRVAVDVTGYKSVADAVKADPKQFNSTATTNAAPAGFFGVVVGEKAGKPVVEAVAPESPADEAGVKEGDTVVKVGGEPATSAAMVRDAL